jgi:hypothetical protein
MCAHMHARMHTHTGMLFSLKAERNSIICGNMDEPGIMLSKTSQVQKDKHHMFLLTPCMESKTIQLRNTEQNSGLWMLGIQERKSVSQRVQCFR